VGSGSVGAVVVSAAVLAVVVCIVVAVVVDVWGAAFVGPARISSLSGIVWAVEADDGPRDFDPSGGNGRSDSEPL